MPKLSRADQAAKVSATEANRRKSVAIAGRRELELAQLQGKLLSRDAVVKAWSESYRAVRDRMLSIPDRTAAELAVCQSEPEVRLVLRREIEDALTSLSQNPI